MECDEFLLRAGQLALTTLALIYLQAALVSGDLWSDSNWTISNVMVHPCNRHLTNFVLFPVFVSMCIVYSVKLD
eukprot:SAG31_NODE_31708_length_365_cov_0.763158_1_plen_73_part_10